MRKKVIFVFGTRPEAIKMAPLIKAMEKSNVLQPIVCLTGQHKEMLYQVTDYFGIKADYDLELMRKNQTLAGLTARAMQGIDKVLEQEKPDAVITQGDTTSAFIGALAGFYRQIPVGHVEAGLRSGNMFAPFPEEANRTFIGHIATWHFAPTATSVAHLNKENIHKNCFITGNTVIDALFLCLDIIKKHGEKSFIKKHSFVNDWKKIVLVTCHRRENLGEPLRRIFGAIKKAALKHKEVLFVYPVHKNPKVTEPAKEILGDLPNVILTEPMEYPELVWLMNKCNMVLTDSGGIQEEAPALGKPVLVMRDVTERQEAVDAGTAKLVGTDDVLIYNELNKLLTNKEYYNKFANALNPYGNGTTSEQIIAILEKEL